MTVLARRSPIEGHPLLDALPATGEAAVTIAIHHPTAVVQVTAFATDLDQAFFIEADGGDLVLRYAIADIGWFVDEGGAIDAEAWRRGATLYLPDGKAGLYPPVLVAQM